jgi:hypothetical protein
LPNYLAQFYSYAKCQLEIEINDKNVIQDVHGIVDSNKEEANFNETEEGSIEEPLKAFCEIEKQDDCSYTSSLPQNTD